MQKVSLEAHGGVRVLRIERPEVHNCVDAETAERLAEAIEGFAADAGARVLVVAGRGERAFCAGADLRATGTLLSHAAFERASPLGFGRLDPGKPVIAAIEGFCFAGGFELAAWCDFRVASETAEFGVLNRRWGIPLIDGGTQRLPRIVGLGNALYLIESGVRIDAARALRMGFVQELVPAGEALPRALELARAMTEYPRQSLVADRASALETFGVPLDEGLLLERRRGVATVGDPDSASALARFATAERPQAPRPAGS